MEAALCPEAMGACEQCTEKAVLIATVRAAWAERDEWQRNSERNFVEREEERMKVATLRAEVERLRAALAPIADTNNWNYYGDWEGSVDLPHPNDLAIRALEPKP